MNTQMKWRKIGNVYTPDGNIEWATSHATNPVAEHLEKDDFRVYFSPRDSKNRSQIASIDIRLTPSGAIVLKNTLRHILSHGKNGYFDDSGVTVTGLVKTGGKKFLYYLGWNLGVTIPFRNAIGLAISQGESIQYRRLSKAPIVDRNDIDPISISYPFLMWDKDRFRIWYGSCLEWDGNSVSDYQFSIKYAESTDGITWERKGNVVLACDFPHEDAIARPHVIKEDGLYKMWYSMKKGHYYRIGYAESEDARQWKRLDSEAGIDVATKGWDSEMIEYAFVFDHKGQRYMLYNGNGYGKTGFGFAVLEQS